MAELNIVNFSSMGAKCSQTGKGFPPGPPSRSKAKLSLQIQVS